MISEIKCPIYVHVKMLICFLKTDLTHRICFSPNVSRRNILKHFIKL